jgi:hypothetical protein
MTVAPSSPPAAAAFPEAAAPPAPGRESPPARPGADQGVTCSAIRLIRRPAVTAASLCINGFPVTGPCLGASGVPVCCKEDVCGHLYGANGGSPQMQARA